MYKLGYRELDESKRLWFFHDRADNVDPNTCQ